MYPAATSGTFNFLPSNHETVIEAFARCGIDAQLIRREQMYEARRSLNLELLAWSNKGVNIWAVDLQTIPVIAGQNLYQGVAQGVPDTTVAVLDCYWSLVNGLGPGLDDDRIMLPMSRDEFATYPNKAMPGIPTRYWFDRTMPPSITIWQPPFTGQDSTSSPQYVVKYYRLRRLQDANVAGPEQADVEYRFLDALMAGLAQRLALKYALDRFPLLKGEAKEAWELAATANREDAPLQLQPRLGAYWRS